MAALGTLSPASRSLLLVPLSAFVPACWVSLVSHITHPWCCIHSRVELMSEVETVVGFLC